MVPLPVFVISTGLFPCNSTVPLLVLLFSNPVGVLGALEVSLSDICSTCDSNHSESRRSPSNLVRRAFAIGIFSTLLFWTPCLSVSYCTLFLMYVLYFDLIGIWSFFSCSRNFALSYSLWLAQKSLVNSFSATYGSRMRTRSLKVIVSICDFVRLLYDLLPSSWRCFGAMSARKLF